MKILVFQHVVSEHPGSFRDVMAREGHEMHAVELDEGEAIPPLEGYDILLVMGGPMDVWETDKHPWLLEEMAVIRSWVEAGRPYLGLCLGHQLLAQACGGHVGPMDGAPEVGISQVPVQPDPLFAGVPPLCTLLPVARGGGEAPARGCCACWPARRAAASRLSALAMPPIGLQFHMELTHTTAAEWGAMPEYEAALERVRGPGSLPQVQAEVEENYAALNDAAHKIFGNFLRIAETALAVA